MSKICIIITNSVKKFSSAWLIGSLLLVSGCGVGNFSSPEVTTNTTQLDASNATYNAGTVTTTKDVSATTAGGVTAITIPSGTTIAGTPRFSSLPITITVTTPSSGVIGMPQPKTPGYFISSTAGAVDIIIGDTTGVAFSNPVTIGIPIQNPINLTKSVVNMNKDDGNGWINLGTASGLGTVATISTTTLCWFGVDNVYSPTTGSSGSSTGATGTGVGF